MDFKSILSKRCKLNYLIYDLTWAVIDYLVKKSFVLIVI